MVCEPGGSGVAHETTPSFRESPCVSRRRTVTGVDVAQDSAGHAEDGDRYDTFASLFDKDTLERLLLQQGIHPDALVTLLRYAALGLPGLSSRTLATTTGHAGGRVPSCPPRPRTAIGSATCC